MRQRTSFENSMLSAGIVINLVDAALLIGHYHGDPLHVTLIYHFIIVSALLISASLIGYSLNTGLSVKDAICKAIVIFQSDKFSRTVDTVVSTLEAVLWIGLILAIMIILFRESIITGISNRCVPCR